MTVAVIVQARATSTRLPGKILAPILGEPMLAYQLERLSRSRMADEFVLATTTNPADDATAEVGRSVGWIVFRGSEHDVLSRYIGAAHRVFADVVFRSTADCPLIDPATVDVAIARFLHGDLDHIDLAGMPDGSGGECVSLAALEEAAAAPDLTAEDREHVSLYIRRRTQHFRHLSLAMGPHMDRERWTVDTAADLEKVRAVFDDLYPFNRRFTFADVCRFMAGHPEVRALNDDVPMGPIDREMLARLERSRWSPAMGDL